LLVPLLEQSPALLSITLLDVLEEHSPDQSGDSSLRTLQRRVERWRAKYDPDKEVLFLQRHSQDDMEASNGEYPKSTFIP